MITCAKCGKPKLKRTAGYGGPKCLCRGIFNKKEDKMTCKDCTYGIFEGVGGFITCKRHSPTEVAQDTGRGVWPIVRVDARCGDFEAVVAPAVKPSDAPQHLPPTPGSASALVAHLTRHYGIQPQVRVLAKRHPYDAWNDVPDYRLEDPPEGVKLRLVVNW